MWIAIFLLGLGFLILHAVYFSGRVKKALLIVAPSARRWVRLARMIYLAVACSVPVLALGYAIYILIARPSSFGPPATSLYDYVVAYPFWIATIASVQCSLLFVPIDVIHLVAVRLGRAHGPRWAWRKSVLILVIASVVAVYVPVRVAIDGRSLAVREHVWSSPDLPPELDGFEIALIADMQADRYTERARVAQFIDAVNRERPDLIVIAGDMITGNPAYIELAAEQAGRLRAPHGVYACIGDHDNFAYMRDRERSVREVREALARHGVPMLDNELRAIPVGDARIALLLITYNYVARIDREAARALFERARSADVQVVVAHQPGSQLLADARDAGVDLFLTGHTHGGQIRFWLPAYDIAPVRVETPYVRGVFRLGDMLLAVTSGLGVSVAPFRYRATATIDMIELRRE